MLSLTLLELFHFLEKFCRMCPLNNLFAVISDYEKIVAYLSEAINIRDYVLTSNI